MHLAFVLLASTKLPPGEAIAYAYAKLFDGDAATFEGAQGDGTSMTFKTPDGHGAIVALMPGPVPDKEADSFIENSIGETPESFIDDVANHRAHIVVTTHTKKNGSDRRSLLEHTRLVAAVASATDAIGIYDGEGRATHTKDFYVSTAQEDEEPIVLWTGLSAGHETEDTMSVVTLGLGRLGFPNLAVSTPAHNAEEAFSFVLDLVSYMLENGAFEPGDTVGRSEEEKLPLAQVPSPVIGDEVVLRVELPAGT